VLLGFGNLRGGAIFDGHGGWKISDFLSRYIHSSLMSSYQSISNELSVADRLKHTLVTAFDNLEQMIVRKLGTPYTVEDKELSFSGSCGIVALIQDGVLAVANSGDSQAVLIS
jgi:serine/threonine protein phosphatase PrpC